MARTCWAAREAATLIRLAAADKDSRVLESDTKIYLWVVDGSPEQVGPRTRRSDGGTRAPTTAPQPGQRLIRLDLGTAHWRRVFGKCNQPATETTTETAGKAANETAENLRKFLAAST